MDNIYGALDNPIKVSLQNLFLDPNNPRLGEEAPGYDDPDEMLSESTQKHLEARVTEMYQDMPVLEESVLTQGWVAVDAIIVWEHPTRPGKYIVLEGNTRITLLRRLRAQFKALDAQYQSKLKKKNVDEEVLSELKEKHDQYLRAIGSTDQLMVSPLIARDGAQLKAMLPRILGVRHISHAQQWKPYPTNLYLVRLYREEFIKEHGKKPMVLDKAILKRIAMVVSLGETKTRRSIQAAKAFDHFKEKFEDRLPKGESFRVDDQYFFELILQNSYPMAQFGMDKDSLHLPEEGAEALFQWAFSKPRPGRGGDNPNVFYKAENIRLWQQIKNHDDKAGTRFAANFDVQSPEMAPLMAVIEADYLQSRARSTPLDTIQHLLEAFRAMPADALISQSEHLQPMLKDIQTLTSKYLKMVQAAG